MSAQDRTLEQYHHLMQINAASHLIRTARSVGILGELRDGQRTLEQLCQTLGLSPEPTEQLLDAVVVVGIIEKYGEDYALSQAAHLLCQYDEDLGDARWQKLSALVQGQSQRPSNRDQLHFDYLAATQWIHTPAAMEAAEIMNVGGEGEVAAPSILDLGCGSAVWSCAMAYRATQATITAVDNRAALDAAERTADSIKLLDRFTSVVADPLEAELPVDTFDWSIIAQRMNCLTPDSAARMLDQAVKATKPGGKIAVIDAFRGPAKSNLAECIEMLTLQTETAAGRIRTLPQIEQELKAIGLVNIQIAFMSKSRNRLGVAVATKPVDG